jgi:phage-related protein
MTSPGPGGGGLGSALIQVAADVRNFARNLQRDIAREIRRINWSQATGRAAAAGALAGAAFARGFGTAANNGVRSVLRSLRLFVPLLPLIAKGVLGVVGAFKLLVALAPAIAGLVQITGAFAAALPALIVTGVLVGKTISLAFKGVGEAMKAVAEGDAEALDAALKKLTPSAAAFVKEAAKIKPLFDDLQKTVQESFFRQFAGGLTELANPAVLGALKTAMSGISADLGRAAKQVSGIIGAAGRSGQLGRIFAPLERSFERILALAPSFTKMFLGLAEAAGPFVETLSRVISGALGGLIAKVNAAVADGSLTQLFETALGVMSAFGSFLGDLGSIFSSVFSVIIGDGDDALGVLGGLVSQLADFLKTAEGVSLLTTIGAGLTDLAEIISGVLVPLLPVAGKLLGALLEPLANVLGKVSGPFIQFVENLADTLLPVIEELAPVFSQIGVELADVLVPLLELLAEHLVQMAPVMLDMAKIIGPVLVLFFQHLGDLLVELLPVFVDLASFMQNNTDLFRLLAGVIGALLLIVTAAVFVITKIVAVINWWRDTLTDFLQEKGIETLVEILVGFATALGGVAVAIFTHWEDIKGFFRDAWAAITGTVSSGAETVVNTIAALPGRVASFAGGLFNSAVGLGRAIGNGLSNIGNFASEIGGKIVNSVKNGINAVIGSINRGIAQIDNFIPGSLPRMSFFERGGIVDEPTLALMGEKNKREVVLPLTDPARTAELAQQSGLIDLLRGRGSFGGEIPSINITAILDGFGVLRVVDQRVEAQTRRQSRELAFGTRGV